MLMQSKHLIPMAEKNPPFYVVVEVDKCGTKRYVHHYGIEKFPTHLDDAIIEMTPNRCDAIMFCRKKDAEKVAQQCTFRCNCGCVIHVGKLIRVTRSNREKEGVTFGECLSWDVLEHKQDFFDTVYDYEEEETEYPCLFNDLL